MNNPPERNESEIHIVHNGKFYFSTFEKGRHLSWCNLKILQGKNNMALVIVSQPQGYIGIFIANAIEHIATQVTNLFGLDPDLTMFIHSTPPSVPEWPQNIAEDDPMAEFIRYIHSPSNEKFEQVTFQWRKSDESIFERYHVQNGPYYEPILPRDAAKLLEKLNRG